MLIVYNSFSGRFSDSPRAIHRELLRRGLDAEHVWLADPAHLGSFPGDVRTVELASAECVEALEACDVLVANTHTEVEWRKRPHTTYLQTWHGTPLKRIHRDVLWAPPGVHERLQRDVDRWDLLVSPNRASTPVLRRAFRYDREVLETGYPRNDVLLSPDRDAIRRRVRAELGIPDGVRAVLYAPTWRDDVVLSGPPGAIRLALDVEMLARELGADHCFLLRVHYLLTGRLAATEHPAVRDVSTRPEISDLYLAADVLVTDYSSAMFDFAITGKPMLFFTYDLASYRDRLRGFYFDLAAIAPGPLMETSAELLDALRDLPATQAAFADRYAAFRARWCHLDDGHAAQRVVERLLRARAASAA
jgi:CDP-glycerol glycerophosphotransferase